MENIIYYCIILNEIRANSMSYSAVSDHSLEFLQGNWKVECIQVQQSARFEQNSKIATWCCFQMKFCEGQDRWQQLSLHLSQPSSESVSNWQIQEGTSLAKYVSRVIWKTPSRNSYKVEILPHVQFHWSDHGMHVSVKGCQDLVHWQVLLLLKRIRQVSTILTGSKCCRAMPSLQRKHCEFIRIHNPG